MKSEMEILNEIKKLENKLLSIKESYNKGEVSFNDSYEYTLMCASSKNTLQWVLDRGNNNE